MESVLFMELQKSHDALRELEATMSEEEKQKSYEIFHEVAEQVNTLCWIARKEGLLCLEEAINQIPEDRAFRQVYQHLLLLIVDGTDPKLVTRDGILEYVTMPHTPYESIAHIMIIYGMLSIQAGDHPMVVADMFNSMTPSGFQISLDFKDMRPQKELEINIEEVCTGEIRIKEEQKGYLETYLCDQLLQNMDGRCAQCVLFDVEDDVLKTMFLILSGEGRRCILDNIPKGREKKLLKDVNFDNMNSKQIDGQHMAYVIQRAASKMLHVIYSMERRGEIIIDSEETDMLMLLMNFVESNARAEKERINNREMLVNLLRRYE